MNFLKISLIFVVAAVFLNLSAQTEKELQEIKEQMEKMPVPPVVTLPENYEELVKSSSGNVMEKRINIIVGEAITKGKVVLEKVNDILFAQVVPNFAYADDSGEERLGEDLIAILQSNKMEAPRSAQFMNLDYRELMLMKLPFKKRLVDSMVIGADKFDLSLDLTFFVNMNALTNSVYNALRNIKEFTTVYNSSEKYYRTKFDDSNLLFLVRIPNVAYELVYTGELFENIISAQIKEALFLKNVIKDFEKQIEKDKELKFDGRYIKGKDISIDLWFLAVETEMNVEKGKDFIRKALKHESVNVTGSEKKKDRK
ncbi:MAG TPA: hypothetical protein PLX56_00605 [bacterium]|nr:hypothetical protein [bacterium]HPM46903.1 hypothetical protein [bacterium]HQN73671.1 hypothetical protein [bacterium]HQO90802.1 hypothetical protein [bacterium]